MTFGFSSVIRNQGAFYFNDQITDPLIRINKTSPKASVEFWYCDAELCRITKDWFGSLQIMVALTCSIKKTSAYNTFWVIADDRRSLSQNSINALYKDYEGIIWIGTFKKGISFYHEDILRFRLYRHQASDPTSLPFNDVNSVVEDKNGNLWLGTNGGGLIYFDRQKNKFIQYLNDPKNENSLSTNVIVSLYLDQRWQIMDRDLLRWVKLLWWKKIHPLQAWCIQS